MKLVTFRRAMFILAALSLFHVGAASTFVDFCSAERVQAQPLVFENTSDQPLEGALLGTGTTGVLFSNDSGNGACNWFPFAQTLATKGFRVFLYQYAGDDPSADRLGDLQAAITAFSRQGVKRIILIGASQGANLTLIANSQALAKVVATVTLSAEARVLASAGEELAPYAAKVTFPILMITAKIDTYGSNEATPHLYELAPSENKKLLIVPGYAHGTELLKETKVQAAVLDFLMKYR